MDRNYLFIIRQFNDVDHLTPLIDHLCNSPKTKVFVFSPNHQLIKIKNENLDYLKKTYNLQPHSFFDVINLPKMIRVLLPFLNILIKLTKGQSYKVKKILETITLRVYEKDPKWAERLIEETEPNVIIFDWLTPDFYTIKPLTTEAKKKKIPIISVPHGLNVFMANQKYTGDEIDQRWQGYTNFCRQQGLWFDYTVSQGEESTLHLLAKGYKPDEIVALGSMRFSREWLEKYPKIFRRRGIKKTDTPKIKVVIFFSKIRYNVIVKELTEMVTRLAKDKNVELILKPHTRGMELSSLKEVIDNYKIKVGSNISSLELSSWCDIGIVWGSSIGLQILHDKKILIEPLFIDTNRSIYEKYHAACLAKSVDEITELIKKFKENKTLNCYSQEQVDELFRNEVYAGNYNRNIIADYANFLEKLSFNSK